MHVRRAMASMFAGVAVVGVGLACDVPAPKQQLDARIHFTRTRPHDKPGASLSKTMLCTCRRCEVASCCRELEQEQEQVAGKCQDYDFNKCGGLAVSSCEGRCYQHKWRADVALGCDDNRPESCCYSDM